MANYIRIKRRASPGSAGAPSSLQNAELAFNENDNVLYYGWGTGGAGGTATQVISIGGEGAYVTLSTNQTITGNKIFTGGVTADNLYISSITVPDNSIALGTKTTGNYVDRIINSSNITGGVATEAGSATLDLTTTGVVAGSYGSGTSIPTFTVDNKGRLTAAGSASFATTLNLAGNTGTGSVNLLTQGLTATGTNHISVAATGQTLIITSDATNANTNSTIVARDASGNFSAGTITANLTGLATSATNLNITLDDTGAANNYLTFVSNTSGQQGQKADTHLTWNPSTQVLGANNITSSAALSLNAGGSNTNVNLVPNGTGTVDVSSKRITSVADPTQAQDAATKNYVDLAVQGLDPKQSVKAATVSAITLTGQQTIDNVSVTAGDRVLVKDQASASANGIYIVAVGAWTRSLDFNDWTEIPGAYVFVEQGTTNAENGFLCTSDVSGGPINVGAITWVQFSGAGQIVAGAGLTKTGNQLDVVGTANRITVNADSVDIASTYIGQTSISILGTVSAGTWNGTTIGVGYGGTGQTSFTSNGIIYGNAGNSLQVTAAGTWDAGNGVGQILSVNASNVPTWTNTIDGGSF